MTATATATTSVVQTVNQPLTLTQIKQMLKFAATSNLEKPLTFVMTVRAMDLANADEMKRQISQHLFEQLTDSTGDSDVIVGNHRINYVGVKNFEVLRQNETLFQRVEAMIAATIVIEQELI